MTISEPKAYSQTPASVSNSWREIVQSSADNAQIEGLALEYLIDFQRRRASVVGEGR